MSVQSPEPTVVLGSPSDIVSIIPLLVGFHPTASVVVLGVTGPRHRCVGPVVRYDLDAPTEAVAPGLAKQFADHGADAVFIAVYDDGAAAQISEMSQVTGWPAPLPHEDIPTAYGPVLDDCGLDLLDAVLVRESRWWSYICGDLTCCPDEGTAVPDPADGPAAHLAAHAVMAGRAVLPSRSEVEATVAGPTGAERDAALNQFDDAAQQITAMLTAEGVEGVHAAAMTLLRRDVTGRADNDGDLDPAEAAFVVTAMESIDIRDDVATAPDLPLADYLDCLCRLARATPDPYAAPVCSAVACVALRIGVGSVANVAIERALDNDPSYRFAQILDDMSAAMLPPTVIQQWCISARAASAWSAAG